MHYLNVQHASNPSYRKALALENQSLLPTNANNILYEQCFSVLLQKDALNSSLNTTREVTQALLSSGFLYWDRNQFRLLLRLRPKKCIDYSLNPLAQFFESLFDVIH
jgi:hypothetical protein